MENVNHTPSYRTHAKVLIALLCLTTLTIFVTKFDLKAWNVAIALLVASVKVTLVLLYFMHLKFESRLIRVLVTAVFVLFALFIVLTLSDYIFR